MLQYIDQQSLQLIKLRLKRDTRMSHNEDFNIKSYKHHRKHFQSYRCGGEKEEIAKTWLQENNVGAWRFRRMFRLIDPLLEKYPQATWLTCGDGRYGKDAHYIKEKGLKVLASDISDVLLKEGKKMGYIDNYRKENAEALSFKDASFDFVFCKESFHHFPRPMIALYEMLRVSKRGVVLIEPYDKYITQTFFEAIIGGLTDLINFILRKKKSRHRFEEAGNYVYGVSIREMEKAALGMNLRTLAFKGINDYYEKGIEFEESSPNNKLFNKVKRRIRFRDALTQLKVMPYSLLAIIIFKDAGSELKETLKKQGYTVIELPKNPYL